MDGSSSLPLPRPSPQLFLRCPDRPPPPPPPPQAAAAAAPAVHLLRPPLSFRHYSPNPSPPPPNPPRPPPPPAAPAAATPKGKPKPKAKPKAPPANEQKNEREYAQPEVKEENDLGHDNESTNGVGKGAKRPRKPKGPKHTTHKSDAHGANEGDTGTSLFTANNCRYDSSLGLLTKKFINLLQGAEDGTLDLNKAAETLEVQKRRIYDITNVLEGVDLIEKKLKNMIRWKGFDMSIPKEINRQVSSLKAELESLYKEDCRLDDEIREAQEKLQTLTVDEEKRKWLYLSKEDIHKIPCFQESTLIAINAPHGTYVEVPNPDGDMDFSQKHYQILLRSSMGPIDCYLISDHEERFNPDQQVAPDDMDPKVINNNAALALQQMDHGLNWTLEKGGNNAACKHPSEPSRTQEFMSGILRIVPSDAHIDADYWLSSDIEVSITDTWGT